MTPFGLRSPALCLEVLQVAALRPLERLGGHRRAPVSVITRTAHCAPLWKVRVMTLTSGGSAARRGVTTPSGWGGGRVVVSETPVLNAVTSNLFQCDFTNIYVSASGAEWMSGGTKRQCDRALVRRRSSAPWTPPGLPDPHEAWWREREGGGWWVGPQCPSWPVHSRGHTGYI